VPPRSTAELRFVAEGGVGERLRAATAKPFLAAASKLLVARARSGLGSVHSLERRVGRLAARLGRIDLDIQGLGRVDPEERYVIVSLHEGLADALALLHLPLGLRFLARDELFEWPYVGRYLAATRQVRVDTRQSVGSTRRLLREAERVFGDGDSLVVFAQGSILGIEVGFAMGAARIARRLRRPVLPVVLTGSHRVWEHPFAPTLRFGERISMRVLEPVGAADMDGAVFRSLERTMKRIALDGKVAPVRRFRPEADGWWDGYDFEIDPDFAELSASLAARRSRLDPATSDEAATRAAITS
jgi:1-acyl-sn-glycerol-3-phosphate acyltransferase